MQGGALPCGLTERPYCKSAPAVKQTLASTVRGAHRSGSRGPERQRLSRRSHGVCRQNALGQGRPYALHAAESVLRAAQHLLLAAKARCVQAARGYPPHALKLAEGSVEHHERKVRPAVLELFPIPAIRVLLTQLRELGDLLLVGTLTSASCGCLVSIRLSSTSSVEFQRPGRGRGSFSSCSACTGVFGHARA